MRVAVASVCYEEAPREPVRGMAACPGLSRRGSVCQAIYETLR